LISSSFPGARQFKEYFLEFVAESLGGELTESPESSAVANLTGKVPAGKDPGDRTGEFLNRSRRDAHSGTSLVKNLPKPTHVACDHGYPVELCLGSNETERFLPDRGDAYGPSLAHPTSDLPIRKFPRKPDGGGNTQTCSQGRKVSSFRPVPCDLQPSLGILMCGHSKGPDQDFGTFFPCQPPRKKNHGLSGGITTFRGRDGPRVNHLNTVKTPSTVLGEAICRKATDGCDPRKGTAPASIQEALELKGDPVS